MGQIFHVNAAWSICSLCGGFFFEISISEAQSLSLIVSVCLQLFHVTFNGPACREYIAGFLTRFD